MAEMEFDDSSFYSSRPLEERWPPLGAAGDNIAENGVKSSEPQRKSDHERLQDLEEEQEELNGSLLALTSHFAQVQFRLKQVVSAPVETRERLLMELEEFAFQGCPDVRGPHSKKSPQKSLQDYEEQLSLEKKKQSSLIGQLKDQLEEMERCVAMGSSANENAEMSPEKLVEKQRIVIEEMNSAQRTVACELVSLGMRVAAAEIRTKMGLNLEDFEKLSNDDVRKNVDNAIGEEDLVKQLTTQIADLERFVTFLQGEVENAEERSERAKACPCPVHAKRHRKERKDKSRGKESSHRSSEYSSDSINELDYSRDYSLREELSAEENNGCCIHMPPIPETAEQVRSKKIRDASLAIIKRALAVLQLFAISQFGCTGKQIQDQIIQKATSVATPGYFEHLAQLQQAVLKIIDIKSAEPVSEGEEYGPSSPLSPTAVNRRPRIRTSSMSSADTTLSESSDRFDYARDAELVNVVRKDLAMALKALFQHGLVRSVGDNRMISSKSLVACIVPTTRTSLPKRMHIWELFNEYYGMKRGKEYNSTPARRLSEAFGIEVHGENVATAKQFKSLVCAGLNQRRLVHWCRLITKCSSLVEEHYQSWSFVLKTGMNEATEHLERLHEYNFHLPEDLAIRHLTKINDAFGES
ncbi:RUN domain-containing protein 1 [Acropora cervicornis]|uniref:RUN domain-containing protein 1 n=1 Tax=Acropora cervicornis TaxID=6130 RepID=A0AAD9VBJ3_ACRCE|nr:RUN domain-containing protein 1 [Acropora cervicornis]